MQMTEDLIRSVVQQVLNQMGGPASPETNGAARRVSGRWGVYPNVDTAVAAAEAAFQAFRQRPIADRGKAVTVIKSICIEQAEELGRLELDETKIGRLDHKIAKLNVTIPSIPGVEYLRTDNASGDGGLTL
ncbi:MAG: aldehyde dehydrogenase EutE, partial [Isosphaeraceae bacterium]